MTPTRYERDRRALGARLLSHPERVPRVIDCLEAMDADAREREAMAFAMADAHRVTITSEGRGR